MKILKLDDIFDFNGLVSEIVSILEQDGVVILPSDTCYGFLADGASEIARAKIVSLKKMPANKDISLCVADKEMLLEYGEFDEVGQEIIDDFLPGPLTIVVLAKKLVKGFVGLRLPDHNLMCAIAALLGRPVFTTSANVHGKSSPYSIDGFDDFDVDLILDAGVLDFNEPSTVVKVDDNRIEILRDGGLASDLLSRFSS